MSPIIKTATAYDHQRVDRITPIPGAVWRDRRWAVKGLESGGKTDMAHARMEVDHTDTAAGDYTRAHEMVHTVISPEKPPSENRDAYIILEESQIHRFMAQHLDLPAASLASHDADKQTVFERAKEAGLDKMTRRMRAMLAVAVGDDLTTEDMARINELLVQKDAKALVGMMQNLHRYQEASYSEREHHQQQEMAARFDVLFSVEADDKDDDEEQQKKSASSKGTSKSESEGEDEGEDDEAEEAGVGGGNEHNPVAKEKPKSDFERHKELAQWAPMTIEKPPLVHASKALRLLQKRKAQDTGSHIARITRIVSDGFIFGEKKRVQGGTVIVDTSGSMALSVAEIHHLLTVAPATTVALFSGSSREGGILRIVVDKGRIAGETAFVMPGGNYVDGPALDWLAKMPEPRFWVSDGYVVGANGSGVEHLNYCRLVAKRNRILRLHDVPAAIERLTGRKDKQSA